MNMKVRFIFGLGAFALGLAIAGYASAPYAHSGATGVVKERMDLMKRHDELLDRIFAMIRGELPYSEKAVASAAREIKETSGQHLTKLFPKGSTQKPSEALPAIWVDFNHFSHMSDRLRDFADSLERSADRKPVAPSNFPKNWEQVTGMMGRGGMMGSSGGMMGRGGMMGSSGGMMGRGGPMGSTGGGMMGQGSMMGQGGMMGAGRDSGGTVEDAARRVAHMCNACHSNYRKKQ